MNSTILAISGANELLLVALQTPTGLCFRSHSMGLRHNEHIVRLCQDLQVQLQDLDAIAIDLGPGSFTGQRISLSFAKGLSFALDKPLLGFSTFDLWQRYFKETSCPHESALILIDGRKRRFYASLYTDREPMCWDLSTKQLCQTLSTHLGEEAASSLVVSGPGAPLFLEELAQSEYLWHELHFHTPPQEMQLAQLMLVLAGEQLQARNFMKASDGPLYLRKSDAQEQREAIQG